MSGSLRDRATVAFRQLPEPIQRRVLTGMDRHGNWETDSAPVAPPCPPGMTTGSPDFVGVGVPKCGTTWWFSLMMAHPEIHVEHEKELQYFNRRYFDLVAKRGTTESDFAAYRQWFPRPPGTLAGEWTPHYVFAYRLPPVLRQLAPEAKVLILLRDPVERYQSDISRRTTRKRLRIARYRGMARGFYSSVLQPWEAVYRPEELLVLQFEACLADPGTHLGETFRFLGIDDTFRPAGLRSAVNQTRSKRDVDDEIEQLLVRLYEPEVVAVAARYPQLDLSLWPNFTHLAGEVATARAARPTPN
jgi:Sulfotransferase domain